MSAVVIPTKSVSPAALVEAAARDIVARHSAELPDLRGVIILVPDLHAAPDVARALRTAAAQPVLLLPRVLTLRQWAGEVPLDRPVATRAVREAVLYGALAGHRSLGDADRWAVASELLGLFDELTRHAVALPQSADDFARQLERAYRARRNRSLEFEATLVHELWRLMARDASELEPEGAYQLRLASRAAHAGLPLYVLGARRISPSEQRFFEAYAQRAPVVMFEPTGDTDDGVSAVLAAAWPSNAATTGDLRSRAAVLKAAAPSSALASRLSIFGATSPEQEARAVDTQVRQWLLDGKQRIAVVAFDRVTARRARALLERAGVLVRDESGWPMATTSAATVVNRWLDVASGDAWHRDLLDLMKSPFSFYDWPRDQRQHTVWRLEQYIREANVTAGIGNYIELAEQHNDAEVRQLLVRVHRGMHALGRARRPISQWLQALLDSLAEMGVVSGWAADSAGSQVSDLIEGLIDDLGRDTLAVPFAEWRRWLARQLEAASYIERAVDSPVVFTHLAATALRTFDAVLILGCDARHLSGADDAPMFFNQSVRAQLGLPTRQQDAEDTEALLRQLIAATPSVLLTWQKIAGSEHNLLAPPVERLLALHHGAYGGDGADGESLDADALAARVAATELRSTPALAAPPVSLTMPPAPSAARSLLPDTISASAYNSLLACPYQYHARYLLHLAKLDDVQELIEKSDYGQRVHDVLQTFHASHARIGDLPRDAATAELERLSDDAFARDIARNYLARGWLLRWKGLIPDYLEWQREREADGWRWHAGEASKHLLITTPHGRTFKMVGRIDRVDINAGAVAVIDYKTGSAQSLKDKLKSPGEDVQLPVYAMLWGGPVAAALFLSIEREGVKPVPIEEELAALAESARERLGALYDAMSTGQPMPAQGASKVCDYCDMHGLCRRAHW